MFNKNYFIVLALLVCMYFSIYFGFEYSVLASIGTAVVYCCIFAGIRKIFNLRVMMARTLFVASSALPLTNLIPFMKVIDKDPYNFFFYIFIYSLIVSIIAYSIRHDDELDGAE